MKVVNGHNAILGRLASMTAKSLLKGEEISIVNAEQIIITGDPKRIVGKYLKMRRIGNPIHGPFFPRQPDAIARRTIRSMLPYKTPRGRAAFKKLRVYAGVPEALKNDEAHSMAIKAVRSDFIRLGDVSKSLGWKSRK